MKSALQLILLASTWTQLPAAHPERPLPRTVIVLWDSTAASKPRETLAAQMVEPVLARLGLRARHHDIRQPLPQVEGDGDTLGVLTWWGENRLPDPAAYVSWIEKQAHGGKRLVCLGEPGIDYDERGKRTPAPVRARFWRVLGLADTGRWEQVTYDQRIVSATKDMIGGERALGTVLPPFRITVPAVRDLRSHLVVGPSPDARLATKAAHLVVTSPAGGYAAVGYTHSEPAAGRRQWHLDANAFLEQAFGVGETPRPDPAVVSGRPVALIAIDCSRTGTTGRGRRTSVLEAVKELSTEFPDLPFSIFRSNSGPQLVQARLAEAPRITSRSNLETIDRDWTVPPGAAHDPLQVMTFDADALNRSAHARQLVASLRAIQSGKVFPSFATDYAEDAERAQRAEIVRIAPNDWEVTGGLSGVRFDHAEQTTVDTARSSGVVGMMWRKGSLYVALDRAEKHCRIALQQGRHVRARYPLLVESRWRVTQVRRHGDGLICQMRGFGPGEMVWQVPGPGDWLVEVPAKRLSYQIRVGADLLLAAAVPMSAVEGVEVVVRRRP